MLNNDDLLNNALLFLKINIPGQCFAPVRQALRLHFYFPKRRMRQPHATLGVACDTSALGNVIRLCCF